MTSDESIRAAHRQALGKALRHMRNSNGWDVNDAAAKAAIAPMTWRRLEEGLNVRRRSRLALDQMCGWPAGSTTAALDDGDRLVGLIESLDGPDAQEVDNAAVLRVGRAVLELIAAVRQAQR